MVFKLFGFKGSLYGRRKEPKESKNEVICIGYKVNQEYLDSLPPPVLLNTPQASTSKGRKLLTDLPLLEKGKPNGSIPQSVTTKNQATPPLKNAQNSRKEVIKERKAVTKPVAKELFKETPRDSISDDDEKNKRNDETGERTIKHHSPIGVASKTEPEVSATSINTFSSTRRDSDNDKKSTLIFLTENHDDNARELDEGRHSNLYEEMDVHNFQRRPSVDSEMKINFHSSETDSVSKINFGRRSSSDSDGKIDFAHQSKRFVSNDHDANEEYSGSQEIYSSQASSLFFGGPEPETVKLGKTKKKAPGRPSEANSETSA